MESNTRQRNPARPESTMTITNPRDADQLLLANPLRKSLISWEHLPEWSKDNEYIYSSFRPISNSYWKCIKSMFYIHNETGNIYTHLFATLWMLALAVWYYTYSKEHYTQANQDDLIVFALFFLGGAFCFAFSTVYHTLSNHSHATHDLCHKLDFLGIITVTSGCLPPGLWYTFPCVSRSVKFTWIGLDLLAQFLAAIFVLFVKRFRTPAWRPFRGLLFSFMASSAFYPITVAIMQMGWSQADREYGASLYALTILIYVSSVGIYALSRPKSLSDMLHASTLNSEIQSRYPEAWKPDHFDVWGQSHQIFHIGVAVGLTTHFLAFVKAVDQFYHVKGGNC